MENVGLFGWFFTEGGGYGPPSVNRGKKEKLLEIPMMTVAKMACYWQSVSSLLVLMECFSDPLWGLDIFISSGYRHTCMNDVYIILYQPNILFVILQFIDTPCCQTKAT